MDEKKPYTVIAEYIWLGGTGELRSKTKIFHCDKFVNANPKNCKRNGYQKKNQS